MEQNQVVWKNIGRLASTIKVAVKINMTLLCSSYIFLVIPLYLALNSIFSVTMETLSLVDVAVAAATLLIMLWVGVKAYAYSEVIGFLSWAAQHDGLPKDWNEFRDFLQRSHKIAAEEKARWADELSQQGAVIKTTSGTREFFSKALPSLLKTAKLIDDAIEKASEPCMTHADAIKERLDQFISLPQCIAPPFITFGLVCVVSLILTTIKLLSIAVL